MSDSRKWHQLSIRQLLVLVSLVAICLVVWKWSTKAQRTARALEQIGCHVAYDGSAGGWLEQLVGKATLLPVSAIVADRTKFGDAEMRFINHMPKLKLLSLANTSVTDRGLANLRHANSLTSLNLAQTKITDDGLRHLAVRYEVQTAFAQFDESQKPLALYSDRLLPIAEQNVEAASANYNVGKDSFLDLALALRQLIEVREKCEEALANYHRRLAELSRAVGGTIPDAHSDDVPMQSP